MKNILKLSVILPLLAGLLIGGSIVYLAKPTSNKDDDAKKTLASQDKSDQVSKEETIYSPNEVAKNPPLFSDKEITVRGKILKDANKKLILVGLKPDEKLVLPANFDAVAPEERLIGQTVQKDKIVNSSGEPVKVVVVSGKMGLSKTEGTEPFALIVSRITEE